MAKPHTTAFLGYIIQYKELYQFCQQHLQGSYFVLSCSAKFRWWPLRNCLFSECDLQLKVDTTRQKKLSNRELIGMWLKSLRFTVLVKGHSFLLNLRRCQGELQGLGNRIILYRLRASFCSISHRTGIVTPEFPWHCWYTRLVFANYGEMVWVRKNKLPLTLASRYPLFIENSCMYSSRGEAIFYNSGPFYERKIWSWLFLKDSLDFSILVGCVQCRKYCNISDPVDAFLSGPYPLWFQKPQFVLFLTLHDQGVNISIHLDKNALWGSIHPGSLDHRHFTISIYLHFFKHSFLTHCLVWGYIYRLDIRLLMLDTMLHLGIDWRWPL